jgi:Zn-dependent oligopeptidase
MLNYSDLTTSKFDSIKNTYIINVEEFNKQILGISKDQLSWSNLIQPTIDLDNRFVDKAFLEMKSFHTDEKIREYASDISTELEQFSIDNGMRKDIYEVYKHYYNNQYQKEKNTLTQEQISYLEDTMLGYKKLGLDLDDEKYEKVKEIKKEISELTSDYGLKLDNYNKDFEFELNLVPGLPVSFVEKHTVNGKLKVNLKYPDFIPMMEYCKNRDIRKQLSYEFKRRAYDSNVEIAERVFKLRKEQAHLFGFEHHSDYKLQDSMAGSTKVVNTFLGNVKSKIGSLLERDLNILKDLAKKDGIEKLESYDVAYYSRIYTEQTSKLNKEDLKKFFPVERTVENVFSIYQQLLGYTFVKTNKYDNTLWHFEVSVYEVFEGSSLKGYFYLDLFPREGKYGHAAVFPFISKSDLTLPVAAMACNFAKDFMTFDELETFFHEFGHVMHHISSKSTISDTAGFACE